MKRDKNHAYRSCGYRDGAVIVQKEDMTGYQQIFTDGRKEQTYR